jgi:hypothetical protein
MKIKRIPIGTKVFAKFTDEYNEMPIHFIPAYVIEDRGEIFIGVKNDSVGTEKGYFNIRQVTGKTQLNTNNLTNLHIRNNNKE